MKIKTKQCIVFPNQNENSTLLGLLFLLGNQCQLSPVSAGRKELPPLVEGGDPRVEHDVELFKKAKSARFAGDVVASQPLLEEVPGDGEAGARPPEAVDVPAQGGALLLLVLLLHVICVPVMSLPKRTSSQASVGLHLVVVARVGGGDGGLVDHS